MMKYISFKGIIFLIEWEPLWKHSLKHCIKCIKSIWKCFLFHFGHTTYIYRGKYLQPSRTWTENWKIQWKYTGMENFSPIIIPKSSYNIMKINNLHVLEDLAYITVSKKFSKQQRWWGCPQLTSCVCPVNHINWVQDWDWGICIV